MRLRSLTAFALTAVVLSLVPSIGKADGLLYQLPKDGVWILYDAKGSVNDMELDGSLKMSSVGTATENDEPCRWIEFTMVMNVNGQDSTVNAKLLIPEKHLKEGENPVPNRVRGWIKMGADSEAVELTDERLGPVQAFLAGPLQDVKKLEPVVVESKLGKLECAGVSGLIEFMERGRTSKITGDIRRHAKAPFGVVSVDWRIEVDGSEQGKLTLKLNETGTDAESELPDLE